MLYCDGVNYDVPEQCNMKQELMVKMQKHRMFLIRFAIVLCLLSIGAWVAYVLFGRPELAIDDARIFFVYAENILDGHGIVYNGGGERVEGFTSPLWLLIITAAFAVFNEPEFWLLVFCLVVLSGAISALWYFEISKKLLSWQSIFFVIWIIAAPGYIVWMTLPLMDVAIWSAILIISTLITIRTESSILLAISAVLLVITRPEGVLWFLVFATLFGLKFAIDQGVKRAFRSLLLPLAVYIAAVIVLFGVRYAYFGYLLPNTYYAKVSPDHIYNLTQGSLYLLSFVSSYLPAMVIVLWASIAGITFNLPKLMRIIRRPQAHDVIRMNVTYLMVSIIAIMGLVIPVISGGDYFHLYRFYQPVWPLLFLPVLQLFSTVQIPVASSVKYGLFAGLMTILILTPGSRWDTLSDNFFVTEFRVARWGSRVGKQLNDLFGENLPSVAIPAAGAFALEYDGTTVDIFGLNNVAMAHSSGNRYGLKNHGAFDTDVFLDQMPQLFLPATGLKDVLLNLDPKSAANGQLKGIFDDPRFVQSYALAVISDADTSVRAWVRRDFVKALADRGVDVIEIDY